VVTPSMGLLRVVTTLSALIRRCLSRPYNGYMTCE
jgi:hypothetical protein